MSPSTIFHVDADVRMRRRLEALAGAVGLPVKGHATAQAFRMACHPEQPGCLVVEFRLPDQGGLDLLADCARGGVFLPAVLVTSHAEIALAVEAMRRGAVHVLEKTCSDQALLDALHEALDRDTRQRPLRASHLATGQCLAQFTAGESDVLRLLLRGYGYKQIASTLQVSCKTVEARRARIRERLGCASAAELIKQVLSYQFWLAALPVWERQALPPQPDWLPFE